MYSRQEGKACQLMQLPIKTGRRSDEIDESRDEELYHYV